MAWKLNLDSMIVIFRFHNFSEIFNFSVASKHPLSCYFREIIHWDKKEFFPLMLNYITSLLILWSNQIQHLYKKKTYISPSGNY